MVYIACENNDARMLLKKKGLKTLEKFLGHGKLRETHNKIYRSAQRKCVLTSRFDIFIRFISDKDTLTRDHARYIESVKICTAVTFLRASTGSSQRSEKKKQTIRFIGNRWKSSKDRDDFVCLFGITGKIQIEAIKVVRHLLRILNKVWLAKVSTKISSTYITLFLSWN